MTRSTRNKVNDTLAPKLILKIFTLLGEALVLVGKPFYRVLSYLLIALLSIYYITGYLFRGIFKEVSNKYFIIKSFFKKKPHKTKKSGLIYPGSKVEKYKTFLKSQALILGSWFLHTLRRFRELTLTKLPKLYKIKIILRITRISAFVSAVRIPKLKLLLATTLFVLLASSSGIYGFWSIILYDLPQPHELTSRDIEVSTKIYDRNDVLLYNIYKDQNRTPVKLSRIPAHVRLATIAVEDAEFYNHPGISLRGIARAMVKAVREDKITGGSTITQQLVKNAFLTPEKTLTRKLKEIVLAVKVENEFTKDEILEMYLNEVAYGGTAYGIQEASQVYFDKDVDQLSLGQAALLAGLPKSPTKYSPFGSNPEAAHQRKREVLRLMQVNGYINEEQKQIASQEKIVFSNNVVGIKAPHFVMYIRQILSEKYGEDVVSQGGLTVKTTLNYEIQKLTEEIVREEIESLDRLNVGNGAAIVMDTQSGDILAMVGSKNYFDTQEDGNVNLTTALRQPGSSIKVVNYAYALENGYTPLSIIKDSIETFNVSGLPPYTPRNYDGKFRGNLTLRSALAESRNVPAVKVLNSYGVGKMIEQGRKMGITTWVNPSDFGLSLTLGGGEVTLIDLAKTYATIANYGTKTNAQSILKVTNYQGEVLETGECQLEKETPLVAEVSADSAFKCEQEQVLDPRVAYMLIDILRDNRARSPAFGSNSLLVVPNHPDIAVKTGTSNGLRDNLTVGFNQDYLVAVWVGNNDNSPMSRVASGVSGATPIWNKTMSALLANKTNRDWAVPEGLIQLPICNSTNSLACEGCFTAMEWFLEENRPSLACNPEYIKQKNEEKSGADEAEQETPDAEEEDEEGSQRSNRGLERLREFREIFRNNRGNRP